MKHTVGVAVWRGLAVGQMEPRNLFSENFVDSYPRNLSSAKFSGRQLQCLLKSSLGQELNMCLTVNECL